MLFPENDAPTDTRLRRELAKEKGLYGIVVRVLLRSAVCRLLTPVALTHARASDTRAKFNQLQSRRGSAETARDENLIAGLRSGTQDGPAGGYLANEN